MTAKTKATLHILGANGVWVSLFAFQVWIVRSGKVPLGTYVAVFTLFLFCAGAAWLCRYVWRLLKDDLLRGRVEGLVQTSNAMEGVQGQTAQEVARVQLESIELQRQRVRQLIDTLGPVEVTRLVVEGSLRITSTGYEISPRTNAFLRETYRRPTGGNLTIQPGRTVRPRSPTVKPVPKPQPPEPPRSAWDRLREDDT